MSKQKVYLVRNEKEPQNITEAQRAATKSRRPFNKGKEKAKKKLG